MSEPDTANDEVFYEAITWHFPRGLNIQGNVMFGDDPGSGHMWIPANDMLDYSGAPTLSKQAGGALSTFQGWLLDSTVAEAVSGNRFLPPTWLTFAVDFYWT